MRIRHHKNIARKISILDATIRRKIFPNGDYNGDIKKTCGLIVKYKNEIQELLKVLAACPTVVEHAQSRRYIATCLKLRKTFPSCNADLRTGDETYGYQSIEQIERDLCYIASKRMCEFRLLWMLELPERVKELS